MHFNLSVEQVAKAWINPRMATTSAIPENPIDTKSLFSLFDKYNSITYYAGGGKGGGGRGVAATSTKCCATGTCNAPA